jgi:acyl dehydratase
MDDWTARVDEANARLDRTTRLTPWRPILQQNADLFAKAVEDPDPMHIDPEWSKANTPYGGTIAPGLWTTSMFVWGLHQTGLSEEVQRLLDAAYGLNYGFNKLRFVAALPIGAAFRIALTPIALSVRDASTALLSLTAAAEFKGSHKPAVSAEWLLAFVRKQSAMNSQRASSHELKAH